MPALPTSLHIMSIARTSSLLSSLALCTGLLLSCSGDEDGNVEDLVLAKANLVALGDSGVSGTIEFMSSDMGLEISGQITGLTPGMKHGFHIHETGDCSAPDGTSAGGHFNPDETDHGAPGEPSHAGDLGNITADANGEAIFTVTKEKLTIGDGGSYEIVGRGMIVHADSDDLMTQPTGNAGGRIACAVITRADG